MKRFSKLALLLGFVSVVSVQGYSVKAVHAADFSVMDFRASSSQVVGATMHRYFQNDDSESPLAGNNDDSSRLVDAVAGYMKAADGETLCGLFYEPDLGAWQNLYQRVTRGKEFSTLDLIALLDTTKTSIFDAYRDNPMEADKKSYFYIPTLFDNAMQKIFAGRWGISDEPTPDHVINHLKEVYGRVVSGVLTTTNSYDSLQGIVESLEGEKSGSSATKQAHLAALQESVGAVWHSDILSQQQERIAKFMIEFRKCMDPLLSQSSFRGTLEHVHYQNPLVGILDRDDTFTRIALGILNPSDEQEDAGGAGGAHFAFLNPALSVEAIEADLVSIPIPRDQFLFLQKVFIESKTPGKQISKVAFDIVSGLDPATQTNDVLGWVGMISTNFEDSSGKTLSFTPAEQDTLLGMLEQSLNGLPEFELGRVFGELDRLLSGPSVFSLEKILAKAAAACRLVKNRHPAELGRVQHFLEQHQDKWGAADDATQVLVAEMQSEPLEDAEIGFSLFD